MIGAMQKNMSKVCGVFCRQKKPDTFVLATNCKPETVRDFVSMAFKAAGFTLRFEGKDEQEVGIDVATGKH